jgi:cellulose synthase/poly-beta-1,6-N-acetylglucosamine synthase-like glycosyltransferase
MTTVFLAFYFLILLIPSIFGLHRYYLVYLYYRNRHRRPLVPPFEALAEAPIVTVQLPIYNERYVAPRLIQAVCNFDYPRERMEIQVLDDSTDDTVAIVDREIEGYRGQGFTIHHIRRKSREGFKAGALNEGLAAARGEFIAVFDADFVPPADFLKKTIPQFSRDKKIGMVQARWGHLNRDYSLLTQAQSILLDGHFIIEHTARSRSGCFFNFNGTAGIWRKACIEDAGGWSGDTLTEDIDLSYRAQIAGWDFVYLDDLEAPAELPVEINALKSQQHRWAKGSIQVAKKLLPVILRGQHPLKVKMEAFFHLASNFNYLLIALLSFLMPFSIYLRNSEGWSRILWLDLPFFLSASWSVSVFYYHSQKVIRPDWFSRIKYIPFSLALGIGLSVNNAKAVMEGLINKGGEFTRTPKYAVTCKGDSWKEKRYRGKFDWVSLIELAFTIHFTVAMVYVLKEGLYLSLPFVALFQVGYLYAAALSFFQSRVSSKWLAAPQAAACPPQIS